MSNNLPVKPGNNQASRANKQGHELKLASKVSGLRFIHS